MGNSAHAPVKTKESEDGAGETLAVRWGVSCMQGWRFTMEDAHFCNANVDGEGWGNTACFGVLDGHGGNQVAEFVGKHFCKEIGKLPADAVGDALIEAFHTMDRMLVTQDGLQELRKLTKGTPPPGGVNADGIGCTAVVTCLRGNDMIVAWAGDSRAVLCRNGHAVGMSDDHKPQNDEEESRIKNAGGNVWRMDHGPVTQYRVNGDLNVSRAIGDLEYKRNRGLPPSGQMICSTPTIRTIPHEPGDEFMLMCCDGIWDIVSNQEAVDFVRQRLPAALGDKGKLSKIMEELCDHCLSPDLMSTNGFGGDNMTAMLVVFESPDLQAANGTGFSHINSLNLGTGESAASLAGGNRSGQVAFSKTGTVGNLDKVKQKKGGGALACCAWCSRS